jgi:hypothetical protein
LRSASRCRAQEKIDDAYASGRINRSQWRKMFDEISEPLRENFTVVLPESKI